MRLLASSWCAPLSLLDPSALQVEWLQGLVGLAAAQLDQQPVGLWGLHVAMALLRVCHSFQFRPADLQVSALGSVQGYLLALGASWEQFQDFALKPQARLTGWRHLPLLYRRLVMCLASDALQVRESTSPTPAACRPALTASGSCCILVLR